MSPGRFRRPRCVLFDLDGTLADTAPDLICAVNAVCQEQGQAFGQVSRLRPLVSQGGRAMLRSAFGDDVSEAELAHLVARFIAHYVSAICVQTRVFDGMLPVLSWLNVNDIGWGVVSNKPHQMTVAVMHQLALPGCRAVLGSGAAARPKPYPHGLLLAADKTSGTSADTWYVGDDLRDIHAAKDARMISIAAAWGYVAADDSLDAWQADAVVASPADLLRLLEQSVRE